jgi:hypothetical protein
MPRAVLNEVLDELKLLTPEEQRQLREAIDRLLSSAAAPPTEDDFEQELLRSGFLEKVKLPPADVEPIQDWRPIDIAGKPLSETIIEERR